MLIWRNKIIAILAFSHANINVEGKGNVFVKYFQTKAQNVAPIAQFSFSSS